MPLKSKKLAFLLEKCESREAMEECLEAYCFSKYCRGQNSTGVGRKLWLLSLYLRATDRSHVANQIRPIIISLANEVLIPEYGCNRLGSVFLRSDPGIEAWNTVRRTVPKSFRKSIHSILQVQAELNEVDEGLDARDPVRFLNNDSDPEGRNDQETDSVVRYRTRSSNVDSVNNNNNPTGPLGRLTSLRRLARPRTAPSAAPSSVNSSRSTPPITRGASMPVPSHNHQTCFSAPGTDLPPIGIMRTLSENSTATATGPAYAINSSIPLSFLIRNNSTGQGPITALSPGYDPYRELSQNAPFHPIPSSSPWDGPPSEESLPVYQP